jgi:Family of unknown function (DUF6527)
MGQVSDKLRRATSGYSHWCPGCEEMHLIPDSWTFDGNLESPTFSPSVAISGVQRVFVDGRWNGEWKRDAAGNPIPYVCHYILTAGKLNFQGDCTHALVGQAVPLPSLPSGLRDEVE